MHVDNSTCLFDIGTTVPIFSHHWHVWFDHLSKVPLTGVTSVQVASMPIRLPIWPLTNRKALNHRFPSLGCSRKEEQYWSHYLVPALAKILSSESRHVLGVRRHIFHLGRHISRVKVYPVSPPAVVISHGGRKVLSWVRQLLHRLPARMVVERAASTAIVGKNFDFVGRDCLIVDKDKKV